MATRKRAEKVEDEPVVFIPDQAMIDGAGVEAEAVFPGDSEPQPEPEPVALATAVRSATPHVSEMPAVPASGQWTEEEHDQAVAAYNYALLTNDPEAGRLRTLLGLFGFPGRPIAPRVQI